MLIPFLFILAAVPALTQARVLVGGVRAAALAEARGGSFSSQLIRRSRVSTPGPYEPYPSQPGPHPPYGYPAVPLSYLQGGPVGFGEAVKQAFSHGFVYHGRASRSAYWWWVLFEAIAGIVLELLVVIPAAAHSSAAVALVVVVISIAFIYLALVGLALTIRRLHDIDRSGWWVLIGLVPFVGGIVLLVFTLLEGTPGPNRFQP